MGARTVHHEISGEGPPVVLIHGLGATSDVWYAPRATLSRAYQVITYDRSGCGRSPRGPGGCSIDSWVDELVDLLDRLSVDEAAVIGHSLGSMIAQRFAARNPSRTRALILAGGEAALSDEARAVLTSRAALIRERGLTAVVDPWLVGSLSEATRAENPALVGLLRAMFLANDDDSYAEQAEALRDADVTGDDPRIQCPALLLVGDEDRVTPLDWQRKISAAIPGSRIGILPSTAHMTMLEQPELFTAAVLEFLAKTYPAETLRPTLGT